MKENCAISVIVPFFNSKKDILNCIEILKNQDIKEKIEIIFIDDCSSDETSSFIKKSNLTNFKLISLKKIQDHLLQEIEVSKSQLVSIFSF